MTRTTYDVRMPLKTHSDLRDDWQQLRWRYIAEKSVMLSTHDLNLAAEICAYAKGRPHSAEVCLTAVRDPVF